MRHHVIKRISGTYTDILFCLGVDYCNSSINSHTIIKISLYWEEDIWVIFDKEAGPTEMTYYDFIVTKQHKFLQNIFEKKELEQSKNL